MKNSFGLRSKANPLANDLHDYFSIHNRLETFIDSCEPKVRERLQHKTLEDFPQIGIGNFTELLDKHQSKEVQVYPQLILDYNSTLVDLIGSEKHKNIHKGTKRIWPALVILSLVLLSIWQNNYWLLAGLLLPPLSQFISGTGNPVGKVLYGAAWVVAVLLFVFRLYVFIALPAAFIILYGCYGALRANYRQMIFERALFSENVFLFLLYFNYITAWRTVDGKPQMILLR